MSDQKEITIYDLAKKLQVSTATVSRALNDNPLISLKTRKKIQLMATDLGYRQNNFASNLRKQKSNTIGIIIHELKSNFLASVLSGIEKVTAEAGYDLFITHSAESIKKEIANANNLFHKRVDGVIASLSFETTNLDHFIPFVDKKIPIIFFDRVEEKSAIAKVIIDNYRSGYQATQHLIDQGCKRIVIATGNLHRNVYYNRYRGYEDALQKNNLKKPKDYILINDLSESSAYDVSQQILNLQPRPDGAFITNDFTAAVCMKIFKEHNLRIPDDIAIVGFNNDPISKIIQPTLTTINYPGVLMGEVAATNLVNHLKGKSNLKDMSTIIINSELMIRESSKKVVL